MKAGQDRAIEASVAAEDWFAHLNEVGALTLLPNGNSCYVSPKVPGKPRVVMAYAGSAAAYIDSCEAVVAASYVGFTLA